MKLLHELLTGEANLHESVGEYEQALDDLVASVESFKKKYPDADERGARTMKHSLMMKISDEFRVLPSKIERDLKSRMGSSE